MSSRTGAAIAPDLDLAGGMFAALERRTRIGRGIVRDSYGAGENFAHGLAAETARGLGLEIETDSALNLYMTLAGRDRSLPRIVVGSHMDSVPQGGNYDGAAGVVAGLTALAGLRRAGVAPRRDVTVMAIRAEEASWFDSSYIGSHAAFGRLDPAALDVRRSDSKRPLAEHMAESGADLAALRAGKAHLDAARIATFIEPHIEQGPVLEQAGIPVGIVTGVRGCLRHADARCHGAYAHSGAAPREARHDAVAASVELIQRLNEMWLEREQAGADLVFTVGQLNTDPAEAAPSKVAGETRFVLDFRGLEESVMREASRKAIALAAEIGRRHRVRFELGEPSYSYPAPMDPLLRRRLAGIARGLAIPTRELPSGAGHDAALFATFGVPTAMIFIRNAHGSHNPDEAMDIADFGQATALLMAFLADEKDDQ